MICKGTLKLITPPSATPVTLAEAKEYLRVDESADDLRITSMIKAATSRLEAAADVKFITQTWDYFLDRFPVTMNDVWWDGTVEAPISMFESPTRTIEIPVGPIQSVGGFFTYDDDDTEYTFSNSNLSVDTSSNYGRLTLKLGQTWPSTVLRGNNGIRIRTTVGLSTDAAGLAEDIKNAVLLMVAAMYEARGDVQPEIPAAALMLIEPYRIYKLA